MLRKTLLSFVLLALSGVLHAETTRVYLGTYTRGESEGIYHAVLDTETGQLSEPTLAVETVNPSFVAIHPNGKFLYSVSEIATMDKKKTGGVSAFAIQEDGTLKLLNQQPSGGPGPCHVDVDPSGKALMVANYSGGSAASYPIQEDGSLGEAGAVMQHEGASGVNERRQQKPHAHSINTDPAGERAFVADLGKDQILIYELDAAAGKLSVNDPPYVATNPGGGPRHFSFHPSGKFAYTNLELTSEISAMTYDQATGALEVIQTVSTLPEPVEGNSTAECLVHPSGQWVYVSNRGHNSIAVFAIDQETGKVSKVENESTIGEIPRGFGIDPSGEFIVVGNQKTGEVAVLKIDQETGELESTGSVVNVDACVNARFLVK